MLFSVISNQWGSGEVGKWGSGEVGKWGSGEVGRPLRARRSAMLSRAVAGGSGNGGFSVNSNRRCQIER
jgi:hypothetical protein